jgi:hypothetical protein
MGKTAGSIVVDFQAGTAKFTADVEKARTKIREFGKSGVTETQATRAAFRGLEGNILNNSRAAEKFAEKLLGLGGLAKVAFPVIGGLAFAGMLEEVGSKVYEFFKTMAEMPEKVNGAFRGLVNPIRMTNDELRVSNDRLMNEIAKLEGRRQNTLKLMLDEAIVSADKLAQSLDKDLTGLAKLLKENQVGMMQQIFGSTGTKYLAKEVGGETGSGGFVGRIAEINEQANAEVSAAARAKDANAQKAAETKRDIALQKAYNDEIAWFDKHIAAAQEAAKTRVVPGSAAGYGMGAAASSVTVGGANNAVELEELRKARSVLLEGQRYMGLNRENESLTARKEALTAGAENSKLDQPFQNRLKALDAQIAGIREKLGAIGQGMEASTMAEAWGEALKAIEETNKALEKQHSHLTLNQQLTILDKEDALARVKAEESWQSKLARTTDEIRDQIATQLMLQEAVGKGYEAERRAAVETKVMAAVGPKAYNDAGWMKGHASEVSGIRTGAGAAYDAQAGTKSMEATQGLREQIALEDALARVQKDGAEAVRRAQLDDTVARMRLKGATEQQIQAEIDLYNAKRGNENANALAQLEEEIRATKRLADAQVLGAEAARRAGLESKYQGMQRNGASPEVVNAERQRDELQHQQQIAAEALKAANVYKDQLSSIDQQVAALEKLQVEGKGTLEIARQLRDLEQQRLQVLVNQELAQGNATNGMRAFFLEMQTRGQTAAQTIYEALKSALDRTSEQFANLFTGKKTSWGKLFEDIGHQMVQSSVKGAMQKGLGALGSAFGIKGLGAGKPDGTESNPLHVKVVGGAGLSGVGSLGGGQGEVNGEEGANSASSLGFWGKLGAGLLGALIPHAAGGDVSPSGAYLVGEQGPEILTGMSGHITSNLASRRLMGSGGASYYIDARGTDPALVEERVKRSLVAVHGSAVATSVQANSELQKRTPQR